MTTIRQLVIAGIFNRLNTLDTDPSDDSFNDLLTDISAMIQKHEDR